MKITNLGRLLRKFRIDKSMLLADMATLLNISPAYLSLIELGRRSIPDNFILSFKKHDIFTKKDIDEIQKAIDDDTQDFIITPKNNQVKQVIAGLARTLDDLTPEQIEAISKVINQQ